MDRLQATQTDQITNQIWSLKHGSFFMEKTMSNDRKARVDAHLEKIAKDVEVLKKRIHEHIIKHSRQR